MTTLLKLSPILCAAAALLIATPGQAQFDEPDTIPKWAIGPYVEGTLRSARGTQASGTTLDWSNGAAFGARFERVTGRTVSLALSASYARAREQLKTENSTVQGGEMGVVNAVAELLFKIKPQVPGYFIFGGGAQIVLPETGEGQGRVGPSDTYVEPQLVLGFGAELLRRRKGVLRLYGRFFFVANEDQGALVEDSKSISTDFAFGIAYLFRF